MTTRRKETKGVRFVHFTLAASRALIGSRWPLNVRELKQCIEAAATAALDEVKNGLCTIDMRHLGELVGTGLWQKAIERKDRHNGTYLPNLMTVFPSSAGISIRQEGDRRWLEAGERSVSLRDSKGLRYLAVLVQSAHKQVYALELAGAEEEGDAGVVLDEKAKAAYRARAEALRRELEESSSFNDPGRVERARRELDLLGLELTRAVGLGGRDRRSGSLAERARINVQRRLRDTFRRITEQDPVLGRHVELSVKTGLFCVYAPTWPAD